MSIHPPISQQLMSILPGFDQSWQKVRNLYVKFCKSLGSKAPGLRREWPNGLPHKKERRQSWLTPGLQRIQHESQNQTKPEALPGLQLARVTELWPPTKQFLKSVIVLDTAEQHSISLLCSLYWEDFCQAPQWGQSIEDSHLTTHGPQENPDLKEVSRSCCSSYDLVIRDAHVREELIPKMTKRTAKGHLLVGITLKK